MDRFIEKISQFGPKYIAPFFASIAITISLLLAPLGGSGTEHIFTEPQKAPYTGATMEITADYVIVKGASASPSENTAAQKLDSYLEQISGIDFEVVTDDTAPAEKEIIVGKTSREGGGYTVDRDALGDEGVCIKTVGEKLVISGGEKRGTLYAVYTFLEDYFDCRWFTHKLTVIPPAEKLLIPESIDYTYVPPLIFRQTDWISPARSVEYKVANGLNDNVYGAAGADMGGCVSYAGPFCHTLAALVPESYFEQDETMFALGAISGKRTTEQPCLTNPKTLEVATANVRAWLTANPGATIISVTQNDNQDYCVCKNCRAVDRDEGSHAGTMIQFVNAIAENIEGDFPGVFVDTFAYQYTQAPCKTDPRKNVIVRLCSIECSFSVPLDSRRVKDNREFIRDMLAWSKKCDNLFVWDYTTNYGAYLAPFGNFDVLQKNLQLFAENKVIGVYEEGNYQAAASDGEFAELRCYILANLMWDPYCDVDELMYDFCKAYYGAGYQNIVDFINIMDEGSGAAFNWVWKYQLPFPVGFRFNVGIPIFSNTEVALPHINTEDEIAAIDKLWRDAMSAAVTDDEREHVERSEICWRVWKSCRKVGEFSKSDEAARVAANEELFNDFLRLGLTQLREGHTGHLMPAPDFTLTPSDWKYDPSEAL